MEKIYIVPEDINRMFKKASAFENSIEILGPIPFTLKKIKTIAEEMSELRRNGWLEICELFPELKNKKLSLDHTTRVVTIIPTPPEVKDN